MKLLNSLGILLILVLITSFLSCTGGEGDDLTQGEGTKVKEELRFESNLSEQEMKRLATSKATGEAKSNRSLNDSGQREIGGPIIRPRNGRIGLKENGKYMVIINDDIVFLSAIINDDIVFMSFAAGDSLILSESTRQDTIVEYRVARMAELAPEREGEIQDPVEEELVDIYDLDRCFVFFEGTQVNIWGFIGADGRPSRAFWTYQIEDLESITISQKNENAPKELRIFQKGNGNQR